MLFKSTSHLYRELDQMCIDKNVCNNLCEHLEAARWNYKIMEWLRLAGTSEVILPNLLPQAGSLASPVSWTSFSLQTRLPVIVTSLVMLPFLICDYDIQHSTFLGWLLYHLGQKAFISAPQKPPELLIQCYVVPSAIIWEISLAWGPGLMTVMLLPAIFWSLHPLVLPEDSLQRTSTTMSPILSAPDSWLGTFQRGLTTCWII